MTNNNAVGSSTLPGVLFAALFTVITLAACSGGGGSTSATTPTATYTITASTGTNGTVTPSGATTVAQGASQSYTITPGAGYAIATLVIDGTTVATSATHTFTNVQANHTISATFSAAVPGGIVLSLVPARSSGVAPLAVFFDASATTDIGVTTRPFHDLEYTWSFGDPGSGTWANGAQPGVSSKDSATGPVAAHVFETPGTYIVTMQAYDGVNTNATTTTITVEDPDVVFSGTNTICVSSNTTPTAGANGCPAGAQTAMQSNFATAVNTYALTNRRVLFKRGDTFSAPTSAAITSMGPGILGAFGSGAVPKVEMTGDTAILGLSSSATPTIKDWRIMDFEFDGLSKPNSFGISAGGGFNQLTVLRVNAHHIDMGITINGGVLDYINAGGGSTHTLFDEIFIVESTFWRMYVFAKHLAILGGALGNSLNDGAIGSLTHILRTPVIYKGVISNTTFSRNVGLAIKMHSPTWCDAGSPVGICANPNWCTAENIAIYPELCAGMSTTYTYTTNTAPFNAGAQVNGGYTEHVVVSDNKFIGGNGVWMIAIGAQNTTSDERMKNIIVERNWFVNSTSNESSLVVRSTDVTVRNNIADMTNSGRFIRVQTDGVEPTANNVAVYNNTGYSSLAGGSTFIRVDGYSTNVTVQNNLAYSPNTAGTDAIQLFDGFTAAGYYQSNNSTDTQMKNTDPFIGPIPTNPTPSDFRLASGSYGLDTGAIVKVFSDFFRTSRPRNGVIDLGAVERP
jgi:hypothetical protein